MALAHQQQLLWIAAGGLLMTCTAGPVVAIVIDVVHPGIRATGAAVLACFLNLFGLTAGPFIAGILSDMWSLPQAMTTMPAFSVLAALCFLIAARSYEADVKRINDQVADEAAAAGMAPQGA